MTGIFRNGPRLARSLRPRRGGTPLSADAARRRGEVTQLAFLVLGGREAAAEFLNLPDPQLGGRPLDVAIASAHGAARVTRAIRRLGGARTTDQ